MRIILQERFFDGKSGFFGQLVFRFADAFAQSVQLFVRRVGGHVVRVVIFESNRIRGDQGGSDNLRLCQFFGLFVLFGRSQDRRSGRGRSSRSVDKVVKGHRVVCWRRSNSCCMGFSRSSRVGRCRRNGQEVVVVVAKGLAKTRSVQGVPQKEKDGDTRCGAW